MKLSLKFLRSFVDFQENSKELAEIFSHLGFPCDGIEKLGASIREVRVGKILEKKAHPEADRLSLLKISLGEETLPIVCGAQNMKQGDLVALAPIGSRIPGADGKGLTLKKAKIRGEVSEGMCCSEVELGLSDESDGIWILPASLESRLGESVVEALDLYDEVLDLDVTPNRGDALSIKGMAREFSAKMKRKLVSQKRLRFKQPSAVVQASIESFEDAFAFAACLVKGVQVKETPRLWQQFLHSQDARSLFNLVDISNIVLFEQGHPIHFFDADKIDPSSIGVRRAKVGEKLELLNGQVLELSTEDLVIADREGPLSLAGIMGGMKSSCTKETRNILIEVASFDSRRIRASAKRHGLSSESSFRFERGVAPHRVEEVMERALALLEELSGFQSAEGRKLQLPKLPQVSCLWDRDRVEKKLGVLPLSDDEIFDWLRRLDYGFESKGGAFEVIFPWYRTDVSILEDVMEDIARLMGYEQLESRPLVAQESVEVSQDLQHKTSIGSDLVDSFVAQGFYENLNWSFADPKVEGLFGLKEQSAAKVLNPIHSDQSALRQSLIPGLVKKAIVSAERYETEIRLVEFGPVFSKKADQNRKSDYEDSPVIEEWKLACVYLPRSLDQKRLWAEKVDPLFDFKGRLETALSHSCLENGALEDDGLRSIFHPNRNWKILSGLAGELHPVLIASLDFSGRIFAAEVSLQINKKPFAFVSASAFPPMDLDLSLELDEKITAREVEKAVEELRVKDLKWFRLYDVYQPDELTKKAKKSFTFALRYQSEAQTLEADAIQKRQEKILKSLKEQFGEDRIALR